MVRDLAGYKSNWKFMVEIEKTVHEKTLSMKDLLTAVWERWDHFDKEYCFESVKSTSEKIMDIRKTPGRVQRINFTSFFFYNEFYIFP